jgi:DNA-directed RNA polymerase subunit RPC12/RpoP
MTTTTQAASMWDDPGKVRIACPVCSHRPLFFERKAELIDGRLSSGYLMRCRGCETRIVVIPHVQADDE